MADALPATALDRILELTVLLGEDMTAGLAAQGLTPSRAHLLFCLHERGPTTQRDLARALTVAPRTVTGLVDGLVAGGFVTREPHPRDRRATLVTPTEHGAEVAAGLHAGRAELAARLFGDLPAPQVGDLVDALDRVLRRLREATP